jgi:hypothetical protein
MINYSKIKLIGAFSKEKGAALLWAVILIAIVAGFLITAVSLVLLGLKNSQTGVRRVSALDVAEAGVNYYMWHLVHAPDDYKDGNATPASPPYGPYSHDYNDNTGKKIGIYTIWITPPQAAGYSVSIQSTGRVVGGSENRTIVAKLGIPSFAQFAVVSNDTINDLRFGEDTEIWGPIHNNGGIRFDGIAHGLVTSSVSTYRDPDTGLTEPGVYTTQPHPAQVFLGGTSFPVPTVDFNRITADFVKLKTLASSGSGYIGPSNASGYHIVLKTNDTFDLYKVTNVSGSCSGSATDKINNQQIVSSGRPFPANGVIFVEDKLWIDGQINGAYLTIAAAKIGATDGQQEPIIINNDLKYTNYDGSDKLGLIAQSDISVGLYSEGSFTGTDEQKELRIDAALIAQNGRVGRNYFDPSCDSTYYQRYKITVYGSVATNKRYGFAWICGNDWTKGDSCDSGYQYRNIIFDQNLITVPPPFFPTIGNYAILDWREK